MQIVPLYLMICYLMVACAQGQSTPTTSRPFTPTAVNSVVILSPAVSPTPESATLSEALSGGFHADIRPLSIHDWPSPQAPVPPLARHTATSEQEATASQLRQAHPPERDDIRLAMAYRTLQTLPDLSPPLQTEPLPLETEQQFKISNGDTNTVSQVTARLLAVSDEAYFWFDTAPGSLMPSAADLTAAATAFADIYETAVYYFGPENSPGIDGDPRIHIVHVSPLAVCDVTLETADHCDLAGYFSTSNVLPQAVDANSNMREMFVMNAQQFGTDFYLHILAHEFRHMIEDNYDRSDADWEVEGSAVLSEELLGFADDAQFRGNLFLKKPDQQLNSWTNGSRIPYYGQGYLFNRYLFERLGVDAYRQFAMHPAAGLLAVDEVAASNRLDLTGESVWLDWLTTLAIHNEVGVPEPYQFSDNELDTVTMTAVSSLPVQETTTVHQYAADYYQLSHAPELTVTFTGSTLVPLLDTVPPSGQYMWLAQRANYSNPRLTRVVDLRQVAAATLHYSAYADMEQGHDFAYVSVSVDDGHTWQGLTAANMQGLATADNPAGTALTPRFYTGQRGAWVTETIPLTPYVGQRILLRFEYITDLVLTQGGFAVDNIAIPEIGFFDDAETLDPGWVAEGFTRATAYLPQTWYLQLITFARGVPEVLRLPLNQQQSISFTILNNDLSWKRPILIVAAATPMTLELAHYQLSITQTSE